MSDNNIKMEAISIDDNGRLYVDGKVEKIGIGYEEDTLPAVQIEGTDGDTCCLHTSKEKARLIAKHIMSGEILRFHCIAIWGRTGVDKRCHLCIMDFTIKNKNDT
jgi:hypothetical protein